MKKMFLKSSVLAVACVGLMAGSALALSISFDDWNDGVDVLTINDGGLNDNAGAAGIVGYSGMIGNWTANMSTGFSHPASGTATLPNLDLLSATLQNFAITGGVIAVSATDTYANFEDLDSSVSSFMASIGGTTVGTVDFIANINGIDIATDWAQMHTNGTAFATSASMSLADYTFADTDVWDMTLTAIITQGQGITTFDANIAPVPEPATMLLFGAGLAGLAAVGRRKTKKNS